MECLTSAEKTQTWTGQSVNFPDVLAFHGVRKSEGRSALKEVLSAVLGIRYTNAKTLASSTSSLVLHNLPVLPFPILPLVAQKVSAWQNPCVTSRSLVHCLTAFPRPHALRWDMGLAFWPMERGQVCVQNTSRPGL